MKRCLLVLSLAAVWFVADRLLVPNHACPTCHVAMHPFEQGSPIFQCSKCGFMEDSAFVAPQR